jgi:hypothetical protein
VSPLGWVLLVLGVTLALVVFIVIIDGDINKR